METQITTNRREKLSTDQWELLLMKRRLPLSGEESFIYHETPLQYFLDLSDFFQLKNRMNEFFDSEKRDLIIQEIISDENIAIEFRKTFWEMSQEALSSRTDDIRFSKLKEAVHVLLENVIEEKREQLRKKRRKTIKNIALGVGGIGLFGGGEVVEQGVKNLENFKYPVQEIINPNIPEKFHNTVLIHLSDLHIHSSKYTSLSSYEKAQKVVQKIQQKIKEMEIPEEKIIIALTGDMVSQKSPISDETDICIFENIFSAFGELPGRKFFVEGNHDLEHSNTDKVRKIIEKSGFEYVGDASKETELSQGVFLSGMPSFLCENEKFTDQMYKTVEERIRKGVFNILLTHNAESVDPIVSELQNTEVFAGHTHGGHIGFLKKFILRKLMGRPYKSDFMSGRYELPCQGGVNVSRGMGNSPFLPIRLSCDPEVPFWVFKNKE